jgi:hypothetical protein
MKATVSVRGLEELKAELARLSAAAAIPLHTIPWKERHA